MILQDLEILKRYLRACNDVFDSCGCKDDKKQAMLFLLACQYKQFDFLQVLQKYVLDDVMFDVCGSWSQMKDALLEFSKGLANGEPSFLDDYDYMWSKEYKEDAFKCTRNEVFQIFNFNFQMKEAHLENPGANYGI